MKRIPRTSLAAALAFTATIAGAQTTLTLSGNLDLYGNYMRSSSGSHIVALDDGAVQRSRWGLRGTEDIGAGYLVKFQLEGGIHADTGGLAGSGLFDRQSWLGLSTPYGEFRVGRQNGLIFTHGDHVDFTGRTLGSLINSSGLPARFDNDVAYFSPRLRRMQFEAHVALPESPAGNHPLVLQANLEYADDAIVAGIMTLHALPPTHAAIDKDVEYDNVYASWKYGRGTVYLAFVHSNNITANAASNTAGAIVPGAGGYNAGTSPDLDHFYDIWQVSADYKLTSQLRVGAHGGSI